MKRKPKTLKDLAYRIATQIVPDEFGNYDVTLSRDWTLPPNSGLNDKTASEIMDLHERISRAIPNDFEFFITMGESGWAASVESNDGPMGGFGMRLPISPDRHFLDNLRDYDWNILRREGHQMMDNFDDEPTGPIPEWFKQHMASQQANH